MFRAMFSPIIRSTWLYLQNLVVFTPVAADWNWTILQFQLIQDTSRQQLVWTLPDAVNTVKCSQWLSVSTHPRQQPAAIFVNTTRYC